MRTDIKNINQQTEKMKKFITIVCFSLFLFGFSFQSNAQCGNAYIGGLMDGYTGSAYPKFVMVCASADIADLSDYSIGVVNHTSNSTGTSTGPNGEYVFPAQALV